MSASSKNLHPATPHQLTVDSQVDYRLLIATYERTVGEQRLKIQKLEQELAEVKEHVRKRRDRQLLDLFKQKYDEQSKAHQEYSRDIAANVSSLLAKLKQIEVALQLCMADAQDEMDGLTLPHCDKSELDVSFSGCFSAIGGVDGMGETISMGEVSVGDGAVVLHQALFKADYLDALAQVVAVKCDKYQLEHANMSRLISAARKEVEAELRECRNELQNEVREKEKLKKLLSLAESERLRWLEGYKHLGTAEQKARLMRYEKEKLVEEIVKLMLCTSSLKKERDDKEAQLARFQEDEKTRYQNFLIKVREKRVDLHH